MSQSPPEQLRDKLATTYNLSDEDTALIDGLEPNVMVTAAQRLANTTRPYFSARSESNHHTF